MQTRTLDGRTQVLDPVRRRWVALTPEENVRQRLVTDLLGLGYPAGLLAIEKGIVYQGRTWRADLVAYDRAHGAVLLAECKAPSVALGPDTLDQLARYNAVLGARALVLDNGVRRACCRLGDGGWTFVEALPAFTDLVDAP